MIKQVKKPVSDNDIVFTNEIQTQKLYAVNDHGVIYTLCYLNDGTLAFVNVINKSEYLQDEYYYSFKGCIEDTIDSGFIVYQFDAQQEFFKWALEQITGKKFKKVSHIDCDLVDCMAPLMTKTIEVLI